MKKRILTFLAVVVCTAAVSGQNLDVVHFMRTSPFQNFDNPSCATIYDGYFSLPTGMIQLGVNLGSIRYNNLFETDEQGYPVTLTATRFVNSLAKNNYLGINASMEVFGFGFRVKKVFVTFDHRLRINGDIRYSKDLLGFPVYGNMAYVDEPADMNISANISAYQEFGVSIRHQINDKMTWGIRPKLLSGLANLRAQKLSILLQTDPENYALKMSYDASLQAASIVPFTLTFDGDNGFNVSYNTDPSVIAGNLFKNLGAGIDLGFTYKPLPSLSVSASILDLGFLSWKSSATQMSSVITDAGHLYEDGAIVFTGLTPEDIQQLSDGENVDALLDTLARYFPLDVTPMSGYFTATPMRVVVEGNYEFAKHHCVSAAAQLRFASKYVQPSLTIAYDGCFFNSIDVCVAYTLQRKAFDNLGVALGLNLGYLNVYVGTQNIIAAINYKNASQLSATAGLVFNWGHYKNWKEKYPKTEKTKKEKTK